MAVNSRTKKKVGEFLLFDVLYEDGSRSSNRKAPAPEKAGEEGEDAVKAYLEAQDRKIADASGKSRGEIKAILPVGVERRPAKPPVTER